MGLLIEADAPVVWRGPMIMKTISQFATNVRWGELDVLLIDLPPGTGDAQLSIAQAMALSGAVIVTTPQTAAVAVALRGAAMFEKVGVPILGIVENMAVYCCPNCGHSEHVFGADGGKRMAEQYGVEHLGSLPLALSIREQADSGRPTVAAEPAGEISALYTAVARRLALRIAQKARDFTAKFPTITVSKGT
jgi:ATP-binding protein involved in chromosome partitioning